MKAFGIRPGKTGTAQVLDLPSPEPGPGEVLLKVVEVGICGTDAEIDQGLYGEAPGGSPWLVLGHESLARRVDDGTLVVPMVRRPCPACPNCEAGSQDNCSSGAFTEIGIKGVHGALRELMTDDPRWLIPVPESARPFAVLVEPMSVFMKGWRHAQAIQSRLHWKPKRALVLGAGPIGLLAALALRRRGLAVTVVARKPADSPKGELARLAGAQYVSTSRTPIRELADGSWDFVFEATGSAAAAFDAFRALAVNGALCLTSITGGDASAQVPVDKLNLDLVLGNRVVFGTVNAHREDYIGGAAELLAVDAAFPGVLQRLFTARVSFDDGPARVFAAQREGIKTVFSVGS
jgi:threonine dehydrogenase-like Zn-dependent dehydrogenase